MGPTLVLRQCWTGITRLSTHIVERGIYVEVDGVMQANAAPRLSRTPAGAPKGSGNKGADSQIILKRFGFLDSEISSLIHTGALL